MMDVRIEIIVQEGLLHTRRLGLRLGLWLGKVVVGLRKEVKFDLGLERHSVYVRRTYHVISPSQETKSLGLQSSVL
jgi:hypothetical protein